MKHDFIDIMHDRLSQHEMIEQSGLWQDINTSLDSRVKKRDRMVNRRAFYKVAASVAAAAIVAAVMWTTLRDENGHDSPSKDVAVNNNTPSIVTEPALSINGEDSADHMFNENPDDSNIQLAGSHSSAQAKEELATANQLKEQIRKSAKSSAQDQMTSADVVDSVLHKKEVNKPQATEKDYLAVDNNITEWIDTTKMQVDTPSSIPNGHMQQIPQLWAATEKQRGDQRKLEFSLSYNGFLASSGSSGSVDLLVGAMEEYPWNLQNNFPNNEGQPIQDTELVNIDEKEQTLPMRIGLEVWYPINEKWRVGSGLFYTHLTHKTTTTYTGNNKSTWMRKTKTASYLGIPLEISRVLWNRRRWSIYASAGAMIEFNLKSKLRQETDIELYDKKEFRDKRPQFSAIARLGLQYNVVDKVGIFFEPGASYYFNNGADDNIYMTHPFRFDINLGIKVNIGK